MRIREVFRATGRTGVAVLAAVAAFAAHRPLAPPTAPAQDNSILLPATGGPVVLELFTSQGCSSCPVADHVLSRLGLDERTRGRVVPLAFHVDYWNQLGWEDPFSAPEWSARQRAYDEALGGDGPYTPQLVIDGRSHLNGAHGERVLQEIATVLKRPAGARLGLALGRDHEDRGRLTVAVTADISRDLAAPRLAVLVALFENGIVTEVEAGENSQRSLLNDFIVRRLKPALRLAPGAEAGARATVAFELDPSWRAENLGVAAFAQDPESLWIHGAAILGPSAEPGRPGRGSLDTGGAFLAAVRGESSAWSGVPAGIARRRAGHPFSFARSGSARVRFNTVGR